MGKDFSLNNWRCLALVFLICYSIVSCTDSSENGKIAGEEKHDDNHWKRIGYGGGGAMFYPEVSPHDPGFAFVSCDMTGAYVTYNGGESWNMFNLRSPVDFYVFDPQDSNTVYANSIGLFKSTDKGATWNLLYPLPSETTGLVSRGDHAHEFIVTSEDRKSVV